MWHMCTIPVYDWPGHSSRRRLACEDPQKGRTMDNRALRIGVKAHLVNALRLDGDAGTVVKSGVSQLSDETVSVNHGCLNFLSCAFVRHYVVVRSLNALVEG